MHRNKSAVACGEERTAREMPRCLCMSMVRFAVLTAPYALANPLTQIMPFNYRLFFGRQDGIYKATRLRALNPPMPP